MFPIKVVSDSLGLINLLLASIGLVILFIITLALVKKSALEILKTTNEALLTSNKEQAERLAASDARHKEMMEASREANATALATLEESYRVQLATLEESSKAELKTLGDSFRLQEKRLFRVEIDNERKGRQFNAAREEVRLLEMAVQIAVNCLSGDGAHPKEYERIMQILQDLQELRRTAAIGQDEWEMAQSSMIAYNDTHTDMAAGRSQIVHPSLPPIGTIANPTIVVIQQPDMRPVLTKDVSDKKDG